jgi:uncharacterized protein YegJ (DUF2314 family)
LKAKSIFSIILIVIFVLITNSLILGQNAGIANVSSNDNEMNKIINDARASIEEFLMHWKNPQQGERDFEIKYPFTTDMGSPVDKEHIWIGNIVNKNGKYYGTVLNDADYIKGIKYGDEVLFDIKLISDWKYTKDDILVGGESIIYLLKGLSEEERKNILSQLDYKINEFN